MGLLSGINPLILGPMIKYFQIIEFLSNIGKVNVKFRSNVEILFDFLENMKMPELKILKKYSPIETGHPVTTDKAGRILTRGRSLQEEQSY